MRVSLLAFISALFAACVIAPVVGQDSNTIGNDNNALNYALALERLEATYYQCYLFPLNNTNANCVGRGYNGFSQTDFANAGYNSSVWNAVNLVAAQEQAHVDYLIPVIQSRSVTPVPRCLYNLAPLNGGAAITTVAQFMAISRTLENVGVSAYAGAVNAFTNPDLAQAAVSIASVEARHAAWLDQLLGNQPFNSSGFDLARSPAEVAGIVLPLLGASGNNASCVTTLPTVRPYGVAGLGPGTYAYSGPLAQAANVNYTAVQRANDIKVLNYALTLELLESNFYNAAGALYNQASFTAAGLGAQFPYFGIIGANENTHVAVLRSVISAYGGFPVSNCTYNFTTALSSFQNYLTYAAILENAGVQAYDGAANRLTDTTLQQVAATIAMIEARHAAFLNVYANTTLVNNTNAFPTSFDTPLVPSVVAPFVTSTGLIVSCPVPLTDDRVQPVVLPQGGGVPSTGTFAPSGSSSSSTGRNGAASTASFSMAMIVVAIIASLALVL